jgi:hypothetical protein
MRKIPMKRSAQVTLTVVAAVGLSACGRARRDPCEAASFDETACQQAVSSGGYYWYGSWVPMRYSSPYPYFYDRYRNYQSHGGAVVPAPGKAYGRTATSPAGSPDGGAASHAVTRGGFGSIGAGHGAGA